MRKFDSVGRRLIENDAIWPVGIASYRLRSTTRFHMAGRANANTSDTITQAMGANLITILPWLSPQDWCRITKIAYQVTTGAAGNSRLGIYANISRSTLYPGKLLYDSGNISTAGTGLLSSTPATPINLAPGTLIWLAVAHAAAITLQASALAGSYPLLGLTTAIGANPQVGYQNAFAFAALPDPCTAAFATFATTNIPLIGVTLG